MKAGKKKAMEKFLFKARTVDLQQGHGESDYGRQAGGGENKGKPERRKYSRRQRDIGRWHYKHPVGLDQDG